MQANLDHVLKVFSALMELLFFSLMCVGLILASVFLYFGMVTGDNWVTVCGILFAADRIGSAVSGRVAR